MGICFSCIYNLFKKNKNIITQKEIKASNDEMKTNKQLYNKNKIKYLMKILIYY